MEAGTMSKKVIIIAVCACVAACAAACEAGTTGPTAAGGIPSATESGPTETRTARWTDLPTAGPIPTVEPMVTASPGPAPALELFNVTFPKNQHGVAFLAEMRNNTNQAMIFPGWEDALHLGVEEWWADGGAYYHGKYDVNIHPGPDEKKMNCILYPGEKGIVAFDFYNFCAGNKKKCISQWEKLESPPPQLGYRLNYYEAHYRSWEEIYNIYPHTCGPKLFEQYHPSPENLKYEIRDGGIIINYDMNLILPDYKSNYQQLSWVILYDDEGRIFNVLYTDLIFRNTPHKYFQSGRYHIYGIGGSEMQKQWETPAIDNQWWQPFGVLGDEEMSRVARIRVFNEMSDYDICNDPLE
jgi:hypothetical protein